MLHSCQDSISEPANNSKPISATPTHQDRNCPSGTLNLKTLKAMKALKREPLNPKGYTVVDTNWLEQRSSAPPQPKDGDAPKLRPAMTSSWSRLKPAKFNSPSLGVGFGVLRFRGFGVQVSDGFVSD